MNRWIAVFLLALTALQVGAREAPIKNADPLEEKRLQSISAELRCLVCQNQNIADSDADLAQDFRREIRTMIRDGKSDNEIMEFMVARYGDFVRYRPPFKAVTILLWVGPALLMFGGLFALIRYLRRRNDILPRSSELSADERRKAEALLNPEQPPQ